MKNAERYLTQGKIQAAISEYKQVVENDPKDINSRNMLGDLYIKSKDNQAAVNCYQEVADYYNTQGFAKKAIAIYNKIYRIEPDSVEVASKLAELYHERGAIAEAQKHYEHVAKKYEQTGHKIEALAIWEKVAEISPYDTEICIKIADAYWQNNRKEDAAKAFVDAGNRLAVRAQHDAAVTAYSRSLEVNPEDADALKGYVQSQISLGYPEEGAKALEKVIENQQYHKELNFLLMDCYFDMNEPEKAEEVIVKLVERDPSSYPKLLDLVGVYLETDDLDSAAKILSMVSEHMLVGGESEQLLEQLNEVLARNPEHIAALRLLARYHGWQRDELELQQTLERLAESARLNDSVDDERYALSQYLLLVPHDTERSSRLKEINETHDFVDDGVGEQLLHSNSNEVPKFESFSTLSEDGDTENEGFEMLDESDVIVEEVSDEDEFREAKAQQFEAGIVENEEEEIASSVTDKQDVESHEDESIGNNSNSPELSASDEVRIEDEIESIKFYIEQGYTGLAEKSLSELENEFANRPEFVELREQLPKTDEEVSVERNQTDNAVADAEAVGSEERMEECEETPDSSDMSDADDAEQEEFADEIEVSEAISSDTVADETEVSEAISSDTVADEAVSQSESEVEMVSEAESNFESEDNEEIAQHGDEQIAVEASDQSNDDLVNADESTNEESVVEEHDFVNSFDDFKTELGLDSSEDNSQDDYDEQYQHAVAYQEMGLVENAISGFQDAVSCVKADDGTRRHLNCCTLIGHCFLEKKMPKIALTWFEKAFETPDLSEQEKQGVYYELGNAYEAIGEIDKSVEQFELIYAADVDYRDVGERLESLREKVPTPA